ncbi:type II toxin-antitoxin system VapC family toxin [Demequina silvatica]|uniref:type II toxin-antitoxin system VapC family toxin n=1 Tax=Demequina silvatica TaxID=1638988 RepID=UPI000784954C|nr:type II toxin-antitoxin system VapC family toxin [Demequina silvatica]
MRVLLDTHLLLWAARDDARLSREARAWLLDPAHELLVSPVSTWEIAIKASLGRPDFTLDAAVLRRRLLDAGYLELDVTGAHAAEVAQLPLLHRDPFDRMLVAQARLEGAVLLTADDAVAAYGEPVRRV